MGISQGFLRTLQKRQPSSDPWNGVYEPFGRRRAAPSVLTRSTALFNAPRFRPHSENVQHSQQHGQNQFGRLDLLWSSSAGPALAHSLFGQEVTPTSRRAYTSPRAKATATTMSKCTHTTPRLEDPNIAPSEPEKSHIAPSTPFSCLPTRASTLDTENFRQQYVQMPALRLHHSTQPRQSWVCANMLADLGSLPKKSAASQHASTPVTPRTSIHEMKKQNSVRMPDHLHIPNGALTNEDLDPTQNFLQISARAPSPIAASTALARDKQQPNAFAATVKTHLSPKVSKHVRPMTACEVRKHMIDGSFRELLASSACKYVRVLPTSTPKTHSTREVVAFCSTVDVIVCHRPALQQKIQPGWR